MKEPKKYDQIKILAIIKSINLSRTLQIEHPEIETMYRDGDVYREIVKKLDIQLNYDVGESVALNAAFSAIAGHDGSFEIESFEGLIPDEERKEIAREHLAKKSRELGLKSYKEKRGIHKRTAKQHREDGHEGGLISVIKRGLKLWSDEEKKLAYELSLNSEFQYDCGRNKGKPKNGLIAEVLNDECHDGEEIRTNKRVKDALSDYRKYLKSLEDNLGNHLNKNHISL